MTQDDGKLVVYRVGPRRGWRLARAGALLAAGALLLAACHLDPLATLRDYGPLAVLRGSLDYPIGVLGPVGTVDIGDRCVTFEPTRTPGPRVLLIWGSADVRWDGARREIHFTNPLGETMTIRDGDTVIVSGRPAGDRDHYAGRWVSPPEPRCLELAEFGQMVEDVADPDQLQLPPPPPPSWPDAGGGDEGQPTW